MINIPFNCLKSYLTNQQTSHSSSSIIKSARLRDSSLRRPEETSLAHFCSLHSRKLMNDIPNEIREDKLFVCIDYNFFLCIQLFSVLISWKLIHTLNVIVSYKIFQLSRLRVIQEKCNVDSNCTREMPQLALRHQLTTQR